MIPTQVIFYLVLGLMVSFSYMTMVKYYEFKDEFILYFAPVFIVILWPLAFPVLAVIMLMKTMDSVSSKLASKIKNKT